MVSVLATEHWRAETVIRFRVDGRSATPPYLQIVQQVRQALRMGLLDVGDQLPSVREVVAATAINPNTVLKAYRALEQKGIAAGRPGQGTFIVAEPETVGLETLTTLRRSLTTGWLAEATAAGLDEDGIVALFTSALRDFRERPSTTRKARGSRIAKGVA